MSRKVLAIANCRVSSIEQLLNNSLPRQQISVYAAAEKLEAEIIHVWSGNVSSKAGTNVTRTDLKEMLEMCKQNKNIKFAIFDEYDRYMRSVNEGPYFEVLFQLQGVKVWYASESDAFNGDDAMAKFMRAMSAFKAEGSNEERQRKSISGQTAALKAGRWPFVPKPGYMKGRETGIPELHPVRGPILRDILIRLAARRITPTQALKELNDSDFTKDHSLYKMDKFRKIATDVFNAGIVEIDKQVQVRNEQGLHERLITIEQLNVINMIFTDKPKNQAGPRKNGNPKYAANNITECDNCLGKRNGRFVGFDHTNGKSSKIYERYRCRSCGRYLTRQEMHEGIEQQFKNNPVTKDGRKDFLEALAIVWKQRKAQAEQEVNRINHQIKAINDAAKRQTNDLSATDNPAIKQRIEESMLEKEAQISELGKQVDSLEARADDDWQKFLRFAYGFVEHMGAAFLETSQENRLRCKQIMFPAGFYVNENKKVYTPEISPLITLLPTKKSTEVLQKSHLVRVKGL